MCGIHGIVSISGAPIPGAEILRKMGAVTTHRGPDDEGVYVGDGVALGMRRLSIIDLAGGHQPISNQDDTLWVVCNGEIYNFRELRDDLIAQGHVFKTKSDTEVILHAYAQYGERFVDYIHGMFGFALWDAKKKALYIGRDRLGIKPMYYYQDADRLIFASEAKSILEVPGVSAEIDPAGLHEYLALGYAAAPTSILKGVKKLPVASMMVVRGGRVDIQRYWRLEPWTNGTLNEKNWIDALLGTLEEVVVAQMVSDVPLGGFLSGGIDSSSIVGFMARNMSQPVKTYSIGFDTGSVGGFYNELPYAKVVSQRFRTDHKEIVVRPNVVQLLPKLLWHMDEPVADSAFITTFLVSEFARRDVKVILSGVGGDELFGGYRRYLGEFYGQIYRFVPAALRRNLIAPLARRLPADRHSNLLNYSRLARSFLLSNELPFEERYRAWVGVFSEAQIEQLLCAPPNGAHDALGAAFRQLGPEGRRDPLRTLFEVDLETQLPDDLLLLTDKMTMATSIECRVPFLDRRVVELAALMPSRYKIRGRELKYILKKALGDLLPHEILYRKKRGFGAPMGAWIKNELASLTRLLLSRESVARRGLFNPSMVSEALALHESNKEDYTDHLLAMMNLEVWCRMYLDKQTPADLTHQIEAELAP